MESSGCEITDFANSNMESEENLQLSAQQAGDKDKDLFLNFVVLCESRIGKQSFMAEDRKDNSQVESYQNLEDNSDFLGNPSSHANAYPDLGLLNDIPRSENSFADLLNPQVCGIEKEIAAPLFNVPGGTLESSVLILHETGTQDCNTDDLPEISANADGQNTCLDTSVNHVCDSDHNYAQVETYDCPFCETSFRMENAFLGHLSTHSIYKLHQCKRCKMQFRDQNGLFLHLNTHVEERPYVCLQCHRRFGDENSFKDHRRVHSGETPYVCEICERAFAKKATLQEHLRTHAGVKPFGCHFCPKVYSRSLFRDRHEMSHTNLINLYANQEEKSIRVEIVFIGTPTKNLM